MFSGVSRSVTCPWPPASRRPDLPRRAVTTARASALVLPSLCDRQIHEKRTRPLRQDARVAIVGAGDPAFVEHVVEAKPKFHQSTLPECSTNPRTDIDHGCRWDEADAATGVRLSRVRVVAEVLAVATKFAGYVVSTGK